MITIKTKEISNYIQEKNYSIPQFCEIVGITKTELSKILNGELDFKFSSLLKLSRFFKVPFDWLINNDVKITDSIYY